MASGPSLTADDVALVKAWRKGGEARRVVVVNTTFRAAPWADALFAMDAKWWAVHDAEVVEVFKGISYTTATLPINRRTAKKVRGVPEYRNSGAGAVSLAVHLGAKTVLMLGYDCQHTDGKTHWHGSHPSGLGDAVSVKRWPAKFDELARGVRGRARVVNCSRQTALTCFERGDLAQWLGCAENIDATDRGRPTSWTPEPVSVAP